MMVRPGLRRALHLDLFFVALLLIAPLGCTGGAVAVCGNGIQEPGETCDCGENPLNLPLNCYAVNGENDGGCSAACKLRPVFTTIVTVGWQINGEAELGGSFDTCDDVGGIFLAVEITGSGYQNVIPQVSCGNNPVQFVDDPLRAPLLPGTYAATAIISDAEGAPLAPGVRLDFNVMANVDNIVVANFPLESFYAYDTYRGDLGYRFFWGEMDTNCADASPIVVDQNITLSRDGSALPTYPIQSACISGTVYIADLLPGIYQFRAEGLDAGGAPVFCEEYDLKVGAGVQNPAFLVVPLLASSVHCN